jgi:hypothetical protein
MFAPEESGKLKGQYLSVYILRERKARRLISLCKHPKRAESQKVNISVFAPYESEKPESQFLCVCIIRAESQKANIAVHAS